MLKRALYLAIGTAVGVTIGRTILSRMIFPELYNATYPPLWQDALLTFAVGFVGAFVVAMLIEWVRAKLQPKED